MDGYIYIIHVREFINSAKAIYKVGRTADICKRTNQYPKDSRLVYTMFVADMFKIETEVIKLFRKDFRQRVDIGREYFEGNLEDMIKVIVTVTFSRKLFKYGSQLITDESNKNLELKNKNSDTPIYTSKRIKQPYTCPCCGYETRNKSHMQIHLFDLKKPCPQLVRKLELTDEIKQHIMRNRIYIIE